MNLIKVLNVTIRTRRKAATIIFTVTPLKHTGGEEEFKHDVSAGMLVLLLYRYTVTRKQTLGSVATHKVSVENIQSGTELLVDT